MLKKPHVIYPFLFAVYPLLSFFSHNIQELKIEIIINPLIIITISGIILYIIISLLLKDKYKAGILVSVFSFFFFSFGHIANLLKQEYLAKFKLFEIGNLFPTWAVLLIITVFFTVRSNKNFRKITSFLNIISIVLVAIPVFHISSVYLERKPPMETIKKISPNPVNVSPDMPDIYYIIVERYPSSRSFKNFYQYDNSEFTAFLEKNGFYIAKDSRANYLITCLSLASSLNMVYLDELIKDIDKESVDNMPLYNLIENSKIAPYLKSKGYKYVHIGSNSAGTIKSDLADFSYTYKESLLLNEFSAKFIETTMIFPIIQKFSITRDLEYRNAHRVLITDQIINMEKLTKIEGPKFVFAHLFFTHSPYVFDRSGNAVTEEEENSRYFKENFINQLVFANTKYQHLIETILANSKKDPVIIFQSDEGPYFERLWKSHYYFDLHQATDDELREKSWIMNAYHLPGKAKDKLYPSITPVNTFRLIFNLYFGENFPLLPDKTYAHESFNKPYKLFEVTEKVKVY